MDPILAGVASSMAWALIKGGGAVAKAYVLGDPEEERALYHVLELALLDAIEESTAEAEAPTIEKTKDVLERWFSYPDVQAEVLASVVELRDPDMELLRNRLDTLADEGEVSL